jgi:hypothetical protein
MTALGIPCLGKRGIRPFTSIAGNVRRIVTRVPGKPDASIAPGVAHIPSAPGRAGCSRHGQTLLSEGSFQ